MVKAKVKPVGFFGLLPVMEHHGERDLRKRDLVCCSAVRPTDTARPSCPARSSPNMRKTLPYQWRGVGTDPVPPRPRFRVDNGTVFGLQAGSGEPCKQSLWLPLRADIRGFTVSPVGDGGESVLAANSSRYSTLSATIGSTCIARRAGMRIATKATVSRNNGTQMNAIGSRVPSPNIMLERTPETAPLRTTPNDPANQDRAHGLPEHVAHDRGAIQRPWPCECRCRVQDSYAIETMPYTPIEQSNRASEPSAPESAATMRDGARQTSR